MTSIYKPDKTIIDETPEHEQSKRSSPRNIEIVVHEPMEEERDDPVKLPILRRNTQIKDVLNQDIYMSQDTGTQDSQERFQRSLNTNRSIQNLTARKIITSSSMSNKTKLSSQHSHSKSSASIFKDRYNKNIEEYLSHLEMRHVGRKNISSNMSQLMSSPNYTAKSKEYDL